VTSDQTDDPFLWLEDVHGADALAWVRARNEAARNKLQADPRYAADEAAILAVLDAEDRIPFGALRGDQVFNFWQSATHPKGIWRRTSLESYKTQTPDWEILLDVDALAKTEGEPWVFHGATCAPGLARALISLSRGGGDAHVVREFDLASRTFVDGGFTLPEAKTQIAWLDDDGILFASDFGPGTLTASGYPRIVKLWRRGAGPAQTLYEGRADDMLVAPFVSHGDVSRGGAPLALILRYVSFFETDYFLLRRDGGLDPISLPRTADVKGAVAGRLIATLRKDWTPPGNQTSMPQGALIACQPDGTGPHILFQLRARQAVDVVATGRDAVYAVVNTNVTGAVHRFTPTATGTWRELTLPLPDGGSAGIISANETGPEALFSFESYLIPPTLFADDGAGTPKPIRALPARFDAAGLETQQFEAVSKDGTTIPYFLVGPRGGGPRPTVLYGYGGFEVSLNPTYSANFGLLWLSRGGNFVVANIRGGGEFGPAWHEAALTTNRQRAFDDFIAVANDLIRRGFATPKSLGIMGGSNGGLLVTAAMTQAPELFGAVVCQVPLIDMIRYTKIGAGASWAAEYGDPADPAMRRIILSYSPYQNLKSGVSYPPVFFITATSDDRVTPVHARKMAAKMLESGHDVLFYENMEGGHSAAADHRQAAEMWVLSFVYLAQKLGLK
jgi:prolyl oligopeptidase